MFHKFRERTRRMQEELAEKRAANQLARQRLFLDGLLQAEKIKDPELRKLAIEAIRPSAQPPTVGRPPSGPR
jgi:hypothetical protein